jgi:hypothetical protein
MLVLLTEGIYEVTIKIGSGGMIYLYVYIKFHKDRFRSSKVFGGVHMHTHTHRQHGDLIILQSKESELKIFKKTGSTRRENSGKHGI